MLAVTGCDQLEQPDPGLVLIALRHSIDKLELDFAQIASDFARSDGWDRAGFNTAADWIRLHCHMNSNAVWNSLQVGAQMAKLPATVEAMKADEIGYAHLTTIANTADKVKGFDEAALLPLARRHSPGKFFHKVLHYRHSVDASAYNREQEDLAESRALHLSTAQDGCVFIHGVLDPVSGAAVRNALEPLAQPSGAHDHRKRPQRLADALYERLSGRHVELQVTATAETLFGLAGAAAGEMEQSVPVPAQTVQRMACDATVTRVLLDQDSLVVDVGRSRRVISPTLRKALSIRDGHCRWPGCERPASWCDGHHVVHWVDGGETNLGNLVLLCRRHHRMVHEGGWQLVRSDRDTHMAVAPAVSFGSARAPTRD